MERLVLYLFFALERENQLVQLVFLYVLKLERSYYKRTTGHLLGHFITEDMRTMFKTLL